MDSPQGWYPDPLGRYDHRWFNGTSWTADVSTDGARHVDPLGITSPPQAKRRRWPWFVLAVALMLTIPAVTLGRAVQRFISPNPHEVVVAQCSPDGTNIRIAIDITNLGDEISQFSIFVEIVGEPLRQVVRSATLTTEGIRPERSARVTTRVPSTQQNVECVIVAVGGELPFGIDLGPIEPIRMNAP